jgi:hypothetical protein
MKLTDHWSANGYHELGHQRSRGGMTPTMMKRHRSDLDRRNRLEVYILSVRLLEMAVTATDHLMKS